jgi:hypothetical protein
MKPLTDDALRLVQPQWPGEVRALFERAITCEYATLTQRYTPVTYPVTPYIGEDGRTLDVSTGLTYPAKAERARRNPKVALLYSDPVGTGLANPPVVLVQGLATVRDADLQNNTDRYLRLSMAKAPAAYEGTPRFLLRRMPWYFARIWIKVTPMRMFWWPEGQLERQPEVWEAPSGTDAPPSDPAPTGKALGTWQEEPADWRQSAVYAVAKLGNPVLTVFGDNGFPAPFRVRQPTLTPDGLRLEIPAGVPFTANGLACLTFHTHPELFTGQENIVFVGSVRADALAHLFVVERQLGNWSLAGSKLQSMITFFNNGRKLAPRLTVEAKRRGQPVPVVRLPGE